jgi:hypothetical protein
MRGRVLAIPEEEGVAEDAFGVVCARLVEAVHVELPDEAVDLVVAEVAGEHDLLELVDVLDHELEAGGRPVCDLVELFVLRLNWFYL